MGFLSTFSRRATRNDRLRFLFTVHDMDGDGVVTRDDLELMLRQLAGSSLGLVTSQRAIHLDRRTSWEMLGICSACQHPADLPSLLTECSFQCRLEHIQMVVNKAFDEAGVSEGGLRLEHFKQALEGSDLHMVVDVPTEA